MDPFVAVMVAAGGAVAFLVLLVVLAFYALAQMRRLASDAFAHIKAKDLEDKVRTEALDRTLHKIEDIAPPVLKPDVKRKLARNGEVAVDDRKYILL